MVLIAPRGSATPTGVVPRMRRFQVSGLFHSGMYEFDSGLALVHMTDAARLYRLGDKRHGPAPRAAAIRCAAPRTVRELARAARRQGFYVSDWTRNHANFFRSIEITKTMMFIILLMIVAVAAFNIVATLVMIVKEKQTDIAILRTLGRRSRERAGHIRRAGRADRPGGHCSGAVLGVCLAQSAGARRRAGASCSARSFSTRAFTT